MPPALGFCRLQQIPRSAALDTDADGGDDVSELVAGTNPLVRDEGLGDVTQFIRSPADGYDGIAVTRETVPGFNRALAEGTELGRAMFFAGAAGRRWERRLGGGKG